MPSTVKITKGASHSLMEKKGEDLTVARSLDQLSECLNTQTFNPIHLINQIFPNGRHLTNPSCDLGIFVEQSLARIDEVIQRVAQRKRQTDEEMYSAVRAQATAGARGKTELETAKSAIHQLFAKIQEIKKKATQSEANIQEICAEIRQLDRCKHNLTHTITALRRLQMLGRRCPWQA